MNRRVLRTAIFLSWVILIACSIFKAFGANWFELSVDVDKYSILDTNIWIQAIVCSITSYIMIMLNYLAMCERVHFRWYVHVAFIPYFIGVTIAKLFIPANYHILIDLLTMIVIPIILVNRTNKKYFNVVIGYVLNWGFTSISVYIRNIQPIEVPTGSLIVELVLSIDVFIMLVLYWLYSLYNKSKKEVQENE